MLGWLRPVSKSVIGLVLGVACAVAALGIGQLPFVRTIELKTYDGRMRLAADPSGARSDIVIVAINEDSLRRLEPVVGRWPWPRLVHAQLLNFLARGPAKVVAYDVIFTERDKHRFDLAGEEWTGEESDRELADATARAGNVVHIADAVAEPLERESGTRIALPALPGGDFRLDDSVEERPVVTLPIPGLLERSRAVGHNFVVLDPDGPLRRSVPFIRAGGRWIPSLGAAAAIQALGVDDRQVRIDADGLWIGDRLVPLVEQEVPSYYGEHRTARRALIDYRGGVAADERGASTYREFAFYDLFYAEQQLLAGKTPQIDPAVFKDKVVMVGATAPALDDLFTVPFPGKMPGAQMHAARRGRHPLAQIHSPGGVDGVGTRDRRCRRHARPGGRRPRTLGGPGGWGRRLRRSGRGADTRLFPRAVASARRAARRRGARHALGHHLSGTWWRGARSGG